MVVQVFGESTKINSLAETLLNSGIVFSESEAKRMAEEMIGTETKVQEDFDQKRKHFVMNTRGGGEGAYHKDVQTAEAMAAQIIRANSVPDYKPDFKAAQQAVEAAAPSISEVPAESEVTSQFGLPSQSEENPEATTIIPELENASTLAEATQAVAPEVHSPPRVEEPDSSPEPISVPESMPAPEPVSQVNEPVVQQPISEPVQQVPVSEPVTSEPAFIAPAQPQAEVSPSLPETAPPLGKRDESPPPSLQDLNPVKISSPPAQSQASSPAQVQPTVTPQSQVVEQPTQQAPEPTPPKPAQNAPHNPHENLPDVDLADFFNVNK